MTDRAQQLYAVSERRACRVLHQPRATQRYDSVKDDQAKLRGRIKEIAGGHVTWGYLRVRDRRSMHGVPTTMKSVHTVPWATSAPRSSLRPRLRKTRSDEAKKLTLRMAQDRGEAHGLRDSHSWWIRIPGAGHRHSRLPAHLDGRCPCLRVTQRERNLLVATRLDSCSRPPNSGRILRQKLSLRLDQILWGEHNASSAHWKMNSAVKAETLSIDVHWIQERREQLKHRGRAVERSRPT